MDPKCNSILYKISSNYPLNSNHHLVCLSLESLRQMKGKFFFSGEVSKVGGTVCSVQCTVYSEHQFLITIIFLENSFSPFENHFLLKFFIVVAYLGKIKGFIEKFRILKENFFLKSKKKNLSVSDVLLTPPQFIKCNTKNKHPLFLLIYRIFYLFIKNWLISSLLVSDTLFIC